MKYNSRMLLRMIYDGNTSRCMQFLVEIIEEQDKKIKELEDKVNELSNDK